LQPAEGFPLAAAVAPALAVAHASAI